MTAEPDLPINDAVPAPTKIEPGNLFLWNWRQMQVYARACVAHATSALQAEIEALRAEVERLRAIAGCAYQMAGVHDAPEVWLDRLGQAANGDALPDPDTISDELLPYQPDAVCEAEARAERLAEALREWWAAHRPLGWTEDQHLACPHVNLATDTGKALADALLRDQEEGHEQ